MVAAGDSEDRSAVSIRPIGPIRGRSRICSFKGFTVADLAAKVHAMTGQTDADYSARQAAYDLRKITGINAADSAGRSCIPH